MLDDLEMDDRSNGPAHGRFYRRAVVDQTATQEAGRPIYVERPYVLITVPGDKTNQPDRPVREEDKRRWPREWAAFENDRPQEGVSGTLLSAWGALSQARIEELRYFKVLTVEHLAGVSDGLLPNLGAQARREREMAKAFIESAKSNAPLLKVQAELASRDADIAALRAALKEQGDRLEDVAEGKGLKVHAVREVAPAEVAVAEVATPETSKRTRGRPKATQKENA